MGRKANWPPRVVAHKPSGQDRVRWKGHDHYLGPIGSAESRAAYVELIKRLEAGGQSPSIEPGDITVGQVVAEWSLHATERLSAKQGENYRAALVPLVKLFERLPASQFGGPQLRAVRKDMIAKGWCRSHINRSVGKVRSVWRWAEEEGHAPAGSWAALSAVRALQPTPGIPERPRPVPVPWVSVAHTAYIGASPELRLFILLLWWSGARPGELARLRVKDLQPGPDVWVAKVPAHKNTWRGHERVIVFGPESVRLLEIRLQFAGPDDLVAPSGKNTPYTKDALGQAIKRACVRAGVPPWFSYQTRHSFRLRVSREHGLEAARALMGHRSVQTTAGYAAGVDLELARAAARKAG